MSSAPTTFVCPGCRAALLAGTARCEHCRIRLSGDLAVQLWRVDQQIAALRAQRDWLVTALRRDGDDVLPAFAARSAAGTETRRVLLGLGAVSLIAALTAATALIWPALGVGGQTTVLLIVTAALLAGAVRLQHRLPATADAIAAVGVAATAVDLVAGRRLVAPDLSGSVSHGYWFVGAVLVCAVLGFVGSRARLLHSPTVGAVLASYGAVVALVSPTSVDQAALVGLIGSGLSAVILSGADWLPALRESARTTALVGGSAFLGIGAGASLVSADGRALGLWCGLALSLAVAFFANRPWSGAAGGVLASALLVRADVFPFGPWVTVTAGVSAAVFMLAVVARTSSRQIATTSAAFIGSAAVLVELDAQHSLQANAILGRHLTDAAIGLAIVAVIGIICAMSARVEAAWPAAVGATCATAGAVAEAFANHSLHASADATAVVMSMVFLLGVAALITATSERAVSIAAAVAAPAGAIAAMTVDISISLRDVSTVEVYVIAPAIVTGVLGVLAMRWRTAVSSWSLLPAVFVTTAPTLLLALRGDVTRQVIVLAAAAVLVALGAQRRLVCPLASGAVEIVLVVGRIAGPEIRQLPHWLTLGVLGVALIGLGSTWERRLQDVRRTTERLRPAIAALR